MGLKTRMMCYVMGTLTTGMIICLLLNVSLMMAAFPSWIDDVADSMISSEQDNLLRRSRANGDWANEYFRLIRVQVNVLTSYTSSVTRGDVAAIPFDTYYTNGINSSSVPGWNAADQRSLDITRWWVCHSVAPRNLSAPCTGSSVDSLSAPSLQRLRFSSSLFVAYHALIASGFPVGDSILGTTFEDDGMFISYPSTNSVSRWARWSGVCLRTGAVKHGYDPRCRSWYDNAYFNNTLFSDPYLFASKLSMGVTAAHAIAHYNGSVASPAGVTMADFGISLVTDRVGRTTVLRRGYGYLFSRSGKVVVHPQFDFDNPSGATDMLELEFGSSTSAEAVYFQTTVLQRMLTLEAGSMQFKRGGETWYVAFTPVAVPGYILAVTVPEDDIREPFTTAQSNIESLVFMIVLAVFVVLVFIVSTAFLVSSRIVHGIVAPVEVMVDLTRKINRREFDAKLLDMNTVCKELALLYNVFRQMMIVVKFGNTSFNLGKFKQAIINYEDALQLFIDLENLPGQAVVLNNLGNVFLMIKNYPDAILSYKAAVNITRQLLQGDSSLHRSPSSVGVETVVSMPDTSLAGKLRSLMASRSYNLAIAYQAAGDPVARRYLLECISLFQKMGERERLVACWCDVAKLDVGVGDLHNAELACREAAFVAKNMNDEAGVGARNRCSLAFAAVAEARGEYQHALWLCTKLVAEAGPTIDTRTLARSRKLLARLGPLCGFPHLASIDFATRECKDIVFCLDCSTSMAGPTIRTSLEQVGSIIDGYIHHKDRAAFLRCSSQVKETTFPLVTGLDKALMKNKVVRYTRTKGTPTLGAAILAGLHEVRRQHSHAAAECSARAKWVVLLTKGDADTSAESNEKVLAELRGAPDVGLVVLVIGASAKCTHRLQRWCDTKHRGGFGVFIQTAAGAGFKSKSKLIADAFGAVKKVIGGVEGIAIEELS